MTTIANDPVSTKTTDDPLLAAVLAPGEVVVAHAIGMADAEPWRRVQVHVTARRVVWLDETTRTAIAADHEAIERVAFLSFEAPPWPTYFEADIRTRGGAVTVVGEDGHARTVDGPARAGVAHRHLDIVRLRDDDACRLELAVREARNPN
jgi:hypothetical protein